MKELQMQTTLPTIGFNFEELKTWAIGITEQYTGLVVREEDVVGIKSEMAGLNRMKKNLDDARKETVRKVSEPIKFFEGQIKEVCGIFDQAYSFLGGQVKKYEDQAREEKKAQVQFLIDSVLLDHNLPGFAIPIQEGWLNKTKPMKTVKAEVEGIILAHLKELREKAELEQAKMDRATAIEEKVKAMNIVHGLGFPVSKFIKLHDLQKPLADALAEVEDVFAKAAQQTKPVLVVSQAQAPELVEVATAPARTVRKVFAITYSENNEAKVNMVIQSLRALCINLEENPF